MEKTMFREIEKLKERGWDNVDILDYLSMCLSEANVIMFDNEWWMNNDDTYYGCLFRPRTSDKADW